MTKQEIIEKVLALNLPSGQYIVFGSCPMAVAGLRESNDIDMVVTPDVLAKLADDGWQEKDKGRNDHPLEHDVFEAHTNWDFSDYKPTLTELLERAQIVEGVPFASLEDVRAWKSVSGRPKDVTDVELIDRFLESR